MAKKALLERHRQKIQTSGALELLIWHMQGNKEATAEQLKTARFLVDKYVPSIAQVKIEQLIKHEILLTRESIDGEMKNLGISQDEIEAEWERIKAVPIQ